MRVFVTGATGFIGSAIVQELIAAGHEVLGLARSDTAAESLAAAGARVHRGELSDLDSLRRGATRSDGVIHTGFTHDFANFRAACEADRRAILALGSALEGSERLLVITSGIGLLPSGELATEASMPPSPSPNPRVASEEAAHAIAARGARVSVVRLAPSVHGEGDHGFVPILIKLAREKKTSAYLGDGLNRWPAVHRLDASRLFTLAFEKGVPATYHGVAEEGVPFRDIAEAIGNRLDLPVARIAPEDASSHFGWFAHFAAMDVLASSRRTQEALGWLPTRPGLIEDIAQPAYYAA